MNHEVDGQRGYHRITGVLNDFIPAAGTQRFELELGSSSHQWEVQFLHTTLVQRDRRIPGRCSAPVRIEQDSIICSIYTDEGYWTVAEIAGDDRIYLMNRGSELWDTPRGLLLTDADAGIGWLHPNQSVVEWAPEAVLPGEPKAVTANESNVFVYTDGALLVLDAEDLAVKQVIERETDSGGSHFALVTYDAYVGLFELRYGGFPRSFRRDSYVVSGDEWRLVGSEEIVESLGAAWGADFWTCKDGIIRAYRASGISASVVAEDKVAGECHSPAFIGRPTVTGDGYFQCPFLSSDGRIQFVSLDGGWRSASCHGQYAVMNGSTGHPDYAEETLFMDLSRHFPN